MIILRKVWIYLLLFFMAVGLGAETVVKMPQLINPKNLVVKHDRLLITDYPNVYLYSIPDLSLIKTFGKVGEGPSEFYIDQAWMDRKLAGLVSDISDQHIFINSMGRLSVFTLDGDFIKMMKTHAFRGGYGFKPAGSCFVALQRVREKNKLFQAVKIFDQELKEKREITRHFFWIRDRNFQSGQLKYDFFERANGTLSFVTDSGKIYISRNNSPNVIIEVYNSKGEHLRTIRHESTKAKVQNSFINSVRSYYKIKFKRGLKVNLKATTFPENFPGLHRFFIDNGHVYAITYYKTPDKTRIVVMDNEGKFIRFANVSIISANPEKLYPCSIYKGYFYQLVEVGEEEEWELRIHKI